MEVNRQHRSFESVSNRMFVMLQCVATINACRHASTSACKGSCTKLSFPAPVPTASNYLSRITMPHAPSFLAKEKQLWRCLFSASLLQMIPIFSSYLKVFIFSVSSSGGSHFCLVTVFSLGILIKKYHSLHLPFDLENNIIKVQKILLCINFVSRPPPGPTYCNGNHSFSFLPFQQGIEKLLRTRA